VDRIDGDVRFLLYIAQERFQRLSLCGVAVQFKESIGAWPDWQVGRSARSQPEADEMIE
jgi:hypothetical protein